MATFAASALLLLTGGSAAIAVVTAEEPPPPETVTVTTTSTETVERRAECGTAARCQSRLERMTRIAYLRLNRIRNLVAVVRRDPLVIEAIELACVAYRLGVFGCRRVWAIATCEAGHPGVLPSPRAFNSSSSASGLGQFLPSTWRSTRFARFSVFSPYANAMAIAEWVKAGLSYVHWQASAACWEPRS